MEWGHVFALVAIACPCLALGWCAWRFLARPRAAGLGGRLVQGLGLIGLAALLASGVQLAASALGWSPSGSSQTLLGLLAVLPISWLVLCGGWSVQTVFEETAKDLTGHRHDTLLDNLHYYAALTAAQMLLLALLVAWRWRSPRRGDPVVWAVFALAAANGIAGMAWPWWGT
jgi:hypothetical protein